MKHDNFVAYEQGTTVRGEPDLPLVIHSSDQLGWGDMSAMLCQLPAHTESFSPAQSVGITVLLMLHGALHFEQRPAYGAWQAYAAQPGAMLLYTDGEPLECRYQRRSTKRVDVLRLCLSTDLVDGVIANVTERDSSTITFRQTIAVYDPLLMQLGLGLRQELEQPTPTGALYAQTTAQLLTVHLLRQYSSLSTPLPEQSAGLTPRQLKQVQDYVQENLWDPIKLADLARHVGLSAYHFARLFRRTTGESPHQYVLRQRLERAQWLLKETDAPIVQVALQSGLSSQPTSPHCSLSALA